MRRGILVFLFLGLVLAAGVRISAVRVVGADPVLATLAQIALPVSEGDEVRPEDLERLAEEVRKTGYFEEVRLRLEGDTLVVEVKPNPPIAAVEIEAKAFPPEKLAALLADQLALAPGTTYNPKKAEEARELLARVYREQGFPFTPKVTLEEERTAQGVKLVFRVEEEVPLKHLRISGATLIPEEKIQAAFLPLFKEKKFVWPLYREAVREVARLYAEAGYRGSGVDLKRTHLADATLNVVIRELKIVAVDKDGLEESPVAVGEPFNYDRLVEVVAELTRRLGREVSFEAVPEKDGVRVRFQLGDPIYGTIREIRIEGATAFPEEELIAVMVQRVGDPFSPKLAQADFERILAHYQKAGYALVPRPDFSFEDGVYTQRLREVKIGGYRLEWEGRHRTRDFVVLREMPPPGSLFSVQAIREGIGRLLRLGILAGPPAVATEPGEREDELVVVLRLKEGKTMVIAPALSWSSQTGWSGQVNFSDKNLWGRAHRLSLNLAFVQNDAGENLSFSLSYEIPWLYLDLADLKEKPTSLRFGLHSIPYGNFKLEDTGWEYTERRTGASFSLARPLNERWRAEVGLEGERVVAKLETKDPPEDPAVTEEEARALLPDAYFNALTGLTLTYSDADDPLYPTRGQVAKLHGGLGLVFPDHAEATWFVPLWAMHKSYYAQDGEGREVVALRFASGVILGEPPESRYFTLGGSEPELSMLRGYDHRAFSGTRLLGGSLEYRYDFQFESTLTRTVIGILFVDAGAVWTPETDPELHVGYGVGVQLNLGYGAVQLPAIRLDYGFSPESPYGRLHFRIGPVF